MYNISQQTVRWLITGAVAMSALTVGARDSFAHRVSAYLNNPNGSGSSCSIGPNGGTLESLVTGEASSNLSQILCYTASAGASTIDQGCPAAANIFDVYVGQNINGSDFGPTVAANTGHAWNSGTYSAVYHRSGCQDITALGSGIDP